MDRKLPLEVRASLIIFHHISQAIKRMMIHHGYEGIQCSSMPRQFPVHWHHIWGNAWVVMIELLLQLGLEINYEKLVAPTTSLTFLCIQINSESMTLSLPDDKLADVKCIIADVIQQARVTKHQLQCIAGKLCFTFKRCARLGLFCFSIFWTLL